LPGEGQRIESSWVLLRALFGVGIEVSIRFDFSTWSDIMPIVDNRQSAPLNSPPGIRALELVQRDCWRICAK
jgi:hypothetical protein